MLEIGQKLKSINGADIEVIKILGEGTQAIVYKVRYNGRDKVLKWYKPGEFCLDQESFYDNLRNLVNRGTVDKKYIWPLDIVGKATEQYGYIMDLIPDGYYAMEEFCAMNVRFPSFKVACDAALNIINSFRILHHAGYSYCDVNDGNFFINPKDGDVLICDCDNISPTNFHSGVLGTYGYMAPEVVEGKSMPNRLTDRHSLYVALYKIIFMENPFHGKRYFEIPGFTTSLQKCFYGSNILFMLDPNDKANEPHRMFNKNTNMIWPYLPEYLKSLFLQAFSQEALKNPNKRPMEKEATKAFVRFRNEIISCSCGSNEVFVENGKATKCEACGKILKFPLLFNFGNYKVPLERGTRIYRIQVQVCNDDVALEPVAQVVVSEKDTSIKGIINLNKKIISVATDSTQQFKNLKEREVSPISAGATIKAFDATIKVES